MLQTKSGSEWTTEMLSKEIFSESLPAAPALVAITALDRAGNASPPRVLELAKTPEQKRILQKKIN
jgi:hypothetical protein